MRRIGCVIVLSATLLAGGCRANAQQDPQAYLEVALDELETQHINRARVDWPALRQEARRLARDAATPEDTYAAIDFVIEALGEKHTLLYAAPKPRNATPAPSKTTGDETQIVPEPQGGLIRARFGVIRIPGLGTRRDSTYAQAYTAKAREILRRSDAANVCGWIVDLRGNQGGNMWPMVDGLLPLIGDGPYWAFEIRDAVVTVQAEGGRLYESRAERLPPLDSMTLRHARAPIAVLLDRKTASSGEAVAIAFKGRPNVRYFGETTANFVSINDPVRLPDGAMIQMTVGYSRDRVGKLWTGPIAPDVATSGEAAETAAVAWLENQPCKPGVAH